MLYKYHVRFVTMDMTSHRMLDIGIREYDKIEHLHLKDDNKLKKTKEKQIKTKETQKH